MANPNFIKAFKVPEEAYTVIDQMLSKREQDFIEQMEGAEFTVTEASKTIEKVYKKTFSDEELIVFLREKYTKGLLNLTDEKLKCYKIADFFVFLDVFSVTQQRIYQSFSSETRKALNELYLERYVKGLDKNSEYPTLDEVVPLNQMIERIEKDERQIYLSPCDCRALAGDCDKPILTCLSYRTAPGSYASRGISKAISKEEAVQVVREADKAGLMHTANPYGGICNCCSDCCYLFRAQREISSEGQWPIVRYHTVLDEHKCILCGKCIKRCPFMLFSFGADGLVFESEACVGCGLCVNTCPANALELVEAI